MGGPSFWSYPGLGGAKWPQCKSKMDSCFSHQCLPLCFVINLQTVICRFNYYQGPYPYEHHVVNMLVPFLQISPSSRPAKNQHQLKQLYRLEWETRGIIAQMRCQRNQTRQQLTKHYSSNQTTWEHPPHRRHYPSPATNHLQSH